MVAVDCGGLRYFDGAIKVLVSICENGRKHHAK